VSSMKTTIQVSDKLRMRIKLLALCKRTTYESVLEEVIEKELSKMRMDEAAKTIENNMTKKGKNRRKKR
jgi:predicted transcriptional regulator